MAWQLRKAIKKSTPFGSFSWTVCVPCPPLGRCLVKKRVAFFAVAGAMPLVVAADWCCYFVVVGRSPWWNGIPLLWTASSSPPANRNSHIWIQIGNLFTFQTLDLLGHTLGCYAIWSYTCEKLPANTHGIEFPTNFERHTMIELKLPLWNCHPFSRNLKWP